MSILKLPHWAIIDKFPAFYDTESATAIEMTGKLYAKVNELIEAHEKWVNDVNKAIETYETENNKDYSCFTQTIIKLTADYIGMVDLKIIQHDRKFDEYYKSFTSEIIKTTEQIISDLKENGELDAAILEAVDELETKFGNFKAEVSAKVKELNDTALSFKEKLDLQYNNFVEQTNRAAENLETNYAETKADLETDYTETKAALETNYAETKAALETEKENFIANAQKTFYKFRHFCRIYGMPYNGDTFSNNAIDIDFEYLNNQNSNTSSFNTMCKNCSDYSTGVIPARGFFTSYNGENWETYEVMYIKITVNNGAYILTVYGRNEILGTNNLGYQPTAVLDDDISEFFTVEDTAISRN